MIEPRYGVLQSLFADRVFRIPHYQRFYSWHGRQREDLFSDLKKLATRGQDQHHFMATIVCHRTAETKSFGASQYRIYDIVDGQQRMTTLIILLKCIELAMPIDSEDREDLAKILVKRDGHLILLQTNNANEYIFNRFIRDGIPPEEEAIQTHSDSNLAHAIEDCRAFVQEWQKASSVNALMSLLLHRLGFVVYDTEDSRVVYTVFEVLNSRGLAVDWLDKTKSVLMGRAYELSTSTAAAEAEIQGLQGIWSQIYREIAKESVPGDEILRVTATLYYGPGAGKPRSSDDSLELLRRECDAFQKPRHVSERLLEVARKLVSLQSNVYLGPVTEILHARLLAVAIMSAVALDEKERGKLLEQWEKVTFRIFGLYSKDSRTKVGDYVRMAAKIVTEDIEMRTYNQIMSGLRLLGSDYPIDGAVAEGLVQRNCYEKSPEMCRYILWLYEEHLARKLGAGATVDEHDRNEIWKRRASDSVEHIFPQNPWSEAAWRGKMCRPGGPEEPVDKHVGRIGNLLLLPIVLNQQAKARPFDEKKELYAKHNLRMIHEVSKEASWTLEQIEVRERTIVEWAKTKWCDI